MTWHELALAVSNKMTDEKSQDNNRARFTVMLVEPFDDDRACHKVNVITPTVMRLLWKCHKDQLHLKGSELYSVLSRHPLSGPTAGWCHEAQVHKRLEEGINVPLDGMRFRINNREDALYDHWVASEVGSGRWSSQPMVYVPYIMSNRSQTLRNNHYYVPIDPGSATFDSFTFESSLPERYDGPILKLNREGKYVTTEVDVASMFFFSFHVYLIPSSGC
jgi:hypothetical protein